MQVAQQGDLPSTAEVDGVVYRLGVGSGLVVSDADLVRVGDPSSPDLSGWLRGATVYSLEGVDPHAALIVPMPAADSDPEADFMILWGPANPFPAICQYFDPASDSTPPECER